MEEAGISPDAVSYRTMMNVCAKAPASTLAQAYMDGQGSSPWPAWNHVTWGFSKMAQGFCMSLRTVLML